MLAAMSQSNMHRNLLQPLHLLFSEYFSFGQVISTLDYLVKKNIKKKKKKQTNDVKADHTTCKNNFIIHLNLYTSLGKGKHRVRLNNSHLKQQKPV